MTFERFFKSTVIAVLLAFLCLVWGFRDKGRYVYERRADRAQDILLDSRTGHLFYLNVNSGEGWRREPVSLEENPLTGEQTSHWAW